MKFEARELPIAIKKPFIVWVICLSLFILLFILNNFSKDTSFETLLNNSIMPPLLVLGIVLGGVISFLFFFIRSVSYFLKKGKNKKINGVIKVLKTLLIILILPILLLIEVLKPLQLVKLIIRKRVKDVFSKQLFKRFAFSFLIVIFLFPVWASPYFPVAYVATNILGYVPEDMTIVGTGSMYPTWPKGTKGKTPKELAKEVVGTAGFFKYPNGIVIISNRILGYTIGRGDIATARNDKISKAAEKIYGSPSGVLKRIIAIGGDTVELKDGTVYLNDQPLKEPYIAKPRSTFGEAFLQECKKITIPQDSVFLMGDNRKGSGDSREFGPVKYSDIDYVLPLSKQKGDVVKNWRNTSKDLDEASKIKLDKIKYLELLNAKRKEVGVKPLTYQPKLEQSAFKRGEIILKFDDFSWEATKSAYTMQRAVADVGYSNITYGEAPTQGYFEADELIDNQFQFPNSKKFLLNKDNQEVGIAEVEGEINGCPTQVIVQHFAGYVPPNYKADVIDSWGRVINNMDEIIPSWEKVKDWPNVNKDDLNKLLGLMYKRKNNAEAIYYRMKANQWLTSDEERMIDEDQNLYDQEEVLANRLNAK